MSRRDPEQLRPCDFCGCSNAPRGHAPPPSLGIPIRRPIYTCTAPACIAQGEARRAALIEARDPLAQSRAIRDAAAAASGQSDLFGAAPR